MHEALTRAAAGLERRPPAKKIEFDKLVGILGRRAPSDYLDFMRDCNGAEGFIGSSYLNIWSIDNVLAFGVYANEPSLHFFASNGASEGYAFMINTCSPEIANAPLADPTAARRMMGVTLEDLLNRLRSNPLFSKSA